VPRNQRIPMVSCSSCLHYLNSPRYLAHTAQLTVIEDTRAKPIGV
jgi:hypothetical protein